LKKWLLIVGAAGVAAAGGWWRLGRSSPAADPPPPTLVRAERRSIDATVTATGIVRLRTGAEVRVGAQLSGIVTRLNVTVGSHIERGAVIAEIDARGLGARIAQARAQIAMDEAALNKLQVQMRRTRQLVEAGLIARATGEDLEEDLKNAQAKLEKSKSDLALVESDVPYLSIRAPVSGTVASVSTQQGETVAAAFNAPTFVTIIEDNALEMVAMVDETDIGEVRPSNPVVFTTETYPGREFHGVVERIAPRATIVSGVVNYETGIALRDGVALLKPDMTTNVTIQTAHRSALLIPNQAIHVSRANGQEKFVYVMANGQPKRRDIVLGQRMATGTEVRKGLAAEEQVLLGEPQGAAK
jgi:RND family efflux transporter MFP subunit